MKQFWVAVLVERRHTYHVKQTENSASELLSDGKHLKISKAGHREKSLACKMKTGLKNVLTLTSSER
jgi:hypothetical protein